jgi:uncharacterized Ntn-hydrolase superfamily protein
MFLILLLADPDPGTFSIVARDPQTGELGVAVASRVVDAGYIVPWLEAGAGAIASQALANPWLGVWGLQDLAADGTADEVLKDLLARDSTA